MGTPWLSRRMASAFFACRRLRARIAGSSVSPSSPQFQLQLASEPSRFSSPFAWLCFAAWLTRSHSVKPSWQVTKFTLLKGQRPSSW